MKMYQITEMEMGKYGTQVAHQLIQDLITEGVIDQRTGDRLERTKIVVYREASTFGRFWKKLFGNLKASDSFSLIATIKDRCPDSKEGEKETEGAGGDK